MKNYQINDVVVNYYHCSLKILGIGKNKYLVEIVDNDYLENELEEEEEPKPFWIDKREIYDHLENYQNLSEQEQEQITSKV